MYLLALLEESIIGCTIRRLALINLNSNINIQPSANNRGRQIHLFIKSVKHVYAHIIKSILSFNIMLIKSNIFKLKIDDNLELYSEWSCLSIYVSWADGFLSLLASGSQIKIGP